MQSIKQATNHAIMRTTRLLSNQEIMIILKVMIIRLIPIMIIIMITMITIIRITISLRDRWRGGVRGAVGVRCPPGAVPDPRLQVFRLLQQGSCQKQKACYDYYAIAVMMTIVIFSLVL